MLLNFSISEVGKIITLSLIKKFLVLYTNPICLILNNMEVQKQPKLVFYLRNYFQIISREKEKKKPSIKYLPFSEIKEDRKGGEEEGWKK